MSAQIWPKNQFIINNLACSLKIHVWHNQENPVRRLFYSPTRSFDWNVRIRWKSPRRKRRAIQISKTTPLGLLKKKSPVPIHNSRFLQKYFDVFERYNNCIVVTTYNARKCAGGGKPVAAEFFLENELRRHAHVRVVPESQRPTFATCLLTSSCQIRQFICQILEKIRGNYWQIYKLKLSWKLWTLKHWKWKFEYSKNDSKWPEVAKNTSKKRRNIIFTWIPKTLSFNFRNRQNSPHQVPTNPAPSLHAELQCV